MKEMNKSQLARELGISRTALYRYIKRGLPTNKGLQAAKNWRRNNLDIMQTKEWRIDSNPGKKIERPDYSYEELNLPEFSGDILV